MMTLDKKTTFIRAFDTMQKDARVVINYTRIEEPVTEMSSDKWVYVDRVFVHCNGYKFFVDMWDFKIRNESEEIVDKIVTDDFVLLSGGQPGQNEIIFDMKSATHSLKVLFLYRDKTFRVVESTFDESQVKGALHTRRIIKLPTLEYIDLL